MASIIKSNTYADFNGREILTANNDGALTTQKTNYPAWFAYLSSEQTIANAAVTKIALDKEFFDTDNAFDTSNNRFTVPANKAGNYLLSASIRNKSSTDFDSFYLYIRKNGSDFLFNGIRSEFRETTSITAVVNLNVGDYLDIHCYNGSGAAMEIDGSDSSNFCTYFSGMRVGS